MCVPANKIVKRYFWHLPKRKKSYSLPQETGTRKQDKQGQLECIFDINQIFGKLGLKELNRLQQYLGLST